MDFLHEIEDRKDEIISSTQELLKINSILDETTITNEAPFGVGIKNALEFMLDMASKDGFKISNVNNYAGHIEYGSGEEIIGILCHLDVVPVSNDWKFDPFSATIEDGKIYARGAIDDKGPVMQVYHALKILKDNNIKLNKRVRLILGCDEETGIEGINKYFEKEDMPNIGFSPDADYPLINGEKGMQGVIIKGKTKNSPLKSLKAGERFNIVPDKALMTLDIDLKQEFEKYLDDNNYTGSVNGNSYEINGVSAHAMHPHKGINAVTLLVDFLVNHIDDDLVNYLDSYVTHSNFGEKYEISKDTEEMGNLTMNLGVCNYENNELFLGIDIRFPSDDCVEIIKNNISSKTNFEVSYPKTTYVHYVSVDSPLVKTLMNSYQKYTNDFDSKPYTIGGGTYAKCLETGVAFGPLLPNREDVVHQKNEYISIEDLLIGVAIYGDAIYNLGK